MIRFATRQPSPSSHPSGYIRSLAERMADDIREMAFAGENVSAETLASRGYSADVVKRLAPQAVAIARRQSVRQIVKV